MAGAFILLFILFFITQGVHNYFEKKHSFYSRSLMNKLYWYHMAVWLAYLIYISFSWSDSIGYYGQPQAPGFEWAESYGTGTTFMFFLSYPVVSLMNFNFEMSMMFFAWIGYFGFVFSYLFFRENIPVNVKLFKRWDLLTVLLFLPNMHFWTAALAKGSVMLIGIMMFVYAMKFPKKRWFLLILGSLLTYHVRPHIFLFLIVGVGLGFMLGNEKISMAKKIGIFLLMIGILVVIQDKIFAVLGMDESGNVIDEFQQATSTRSEALSTGSGSGVDMSSYSLPVKLFTFWFRPLFIDSLGAVGIIASFENLLYLILTFKIIRKDFVSFLRKAPSLVKMSFIIFFATSYAMTFVMSNLGIIMRQKSMVMYFLFFVIYYFLAQKKYNKIVKLRRSKKIVERSKSEIQTVT